MKPFLTALLYLVMFAAKAQPSNTLSAADKVYGLSRFWQEANYNFIYFDKVNRKAWDSAYKAMIVTVQQTPNDYAYYRELQRFCALLKDGHTNVNYPQGKDFETMNTMFGPYRFFLQNIEGKAIVVRTNKSKKDEIPVGSEVVEVNGMPTKQFIANHVKPYISSSTDYVLEDWGVSRMLTGQPGDTFRIQIKTPSGKMLPLTLVHQTTEEQEVYPAFDAPKELLDLKWYPNNIAYLSLNSFDDPKIDTLFLQRLPELYKAKGLIVDLRYNGGGVTTIGTRILQYLTNDTLLYGAHSRSRMHVPTFKAWGRFTSAQDTAGDEWARKALLNYQDKSYYDFEYHPERIDLDAKRLVVPTVLLIGHQTASAAEDFLIYADKQPHMIRMGENSFGSTGQPYLFELPGGGMARICTKQDTYPDGREFVGYGVKPDIEVKMTLADYLQQRDPAVEKALTYLKAKTK